MTYHFNVTLERVNHMCRIHCGSDINVMFCKNNDKAVLKAFTGKNIFYMQRASNYSVDPSSS